MQYVTQHLVDNVEKEKVSAGADGDGRIPIAEAIEAGFLSTDGAAKAMGYSAGGCAVLGALEVGKGPLGHS